MKKQALLIAAVALIAGAAEKKVKMTDLPPAVRQAVEEQSKGVTLRGLAKEVENGKTLYEAELKVNGHTKDVTFDESGKVVSVEEEIPFDSIPAAAKDSLVQKIGRNKIRMVESVTENGVTFYEAHYRKGLKAAELKVDASGRAFK